MFVQNTESSSIKLENACSSVSEKTRILLESGKNDTASITPIYLEILKNNDDRLHEIAFVELFELSQSSDNSVILLENLFHGLWENCLPLSTRILVEIGKINPAIVVPVFELALQEENEELHWLTIQEILALAKIHPHHFLPLLKKALLISHLSLHAQYIILLGLMTGAQHHPDLVKPLLTQLFAEHFSFSYPSIRKKIQNLSLEKYIKKFKQATNKNDHKMQSAILIELIDYVQWYPQRIIPLFEQASKSEYPLLQWIGLLQLIRMADACPDQVALALNNIFSSEQSLPSFVPPLHDRVLILLGKSHLPLYRQILIAALQQKNVYIKLVALYELVNICHSDFFQITDILKDVFFSKENHNVQLLVEVGKNNPDLVINFLENSINSSKLELQQAAMEVIAILCAKSDLSLPFYQRIIEKWGNNNQF